MTSGILNNVGLTPSACEPETSPTQCTSPRVYRGPRFRRKVGAPVTPCTPKIETSPGGSAHYTF
eukprot:9470783-Pyramimonas_sp.AAC.1